MSTTEMIIRLQICGSEEDAALAVEKVLQDGDLQEFINGFVYGAVRVTSATGESVPAFARFEGRIHDCVAVQGSAEDDEPTMRVNVMAGDDAKDTLSVQLGDVHTQVSISPTALEAEQIGHLLIAAARDTLRRTTAAPLALVRS